MRQRIELGGESVLIHKGPCKLIGVMLNVPLPDLELGDDHLELWLHDHEEEGSTPDGFSQTLDLAQLSQTVASLDHIPYKHGIVGTVMRIRHQPGARVAQERASVGPFSFTISFIPDDAG